jgi:AcrR family transcriptional regulator
MTGNRSATAPLSTVSNALAAPKGGRKPLERSAVIEKALEILDEDGLSALTMKRLANEVGVALNTLYSAIGSKEELLSGLIDAASGEILNVSADSESWDHALIHLCTSVHESLTAHPAVTQLAMVQARVPGPGVLQIQESFLRLLRAGGLKDQALADAYTTLISYIRGFTLLRVTRNDARAAEGAANLQVAIDDFTPATFPELHAVADYLRNNTSTERFVEGLRQLVAGFTRQI